MKKKVLVFVTGTNGCTLHRIKLPYEKIFNDINDDDNFTLDFLIDNNQPLEELVATILQYDVFIYHRLIPDQLFEAIKGKVVLVNDEDDNWVLNSTHPMYSRFRTTISDKIVYQIKNSDYVTTTTDFMAKKIRALNNNVAVFPNALESKGQFESHDKRNGYVRVGWVGGSSHVADIRMLEGVVNQLPQEVRDKVQFVLCGFDGGVKTVMFPDGHAEQRQMDYAETCWGEFERIFTDNYKNVSEGYKQFLQHFIPQDDRDWGEHYRRIWTKPIDTYANHYDAMDIVLIPLRKDFFNECKSPLKLLECSTKGKAVIINDVEPYKDLIKPIIGKGGEINPEGNCIAIADNKGTNAWVKAIVKAVKNDELRKTMADNLKKLTADGAEYNLNTVCEKRRQWLNNICKNMS